MRNSIVLFLTVIITSCSNEKINWIEYSYPIDSLIKPREFIYLSETGNETDTFRVIKSSAILDGEASFIVCNSYKNRMMDSAIFVINNNSFKLKEVYMFYWDEKNQRMHKNKADKISTKKSIWNRKKSIYYSSFPKSEFTQNLRAHFKTVQHFIGYDDIKFNNQKYKSLHFEVKEMAWYGIGVFPTLQSNYVSKHDLYLGQSIGRIESFYEDLNMYYKLIEIN